MKKLSFLVIGLALAGSLIFYGCEDGSLQEVNNPQAVADHPSRNFGGPCIIQEVCIPEVYPGTRLWFNSSVCLPGSPYQCSYFTGREICFPIIVDCFWRWEEWWIDPWDWREYLDPRDIYDFRQDLKDVIDPREDFGMFRINEHLVGMQYFNDVPGLIDKEIFNVHTSIELDPKTAESLGLKGNIIPAGKYPVAYNEKDGTFNAIVSVDSYPIVKKKQIGVAKFKDMDLTKFLANPRFEQVETSVIAEHANGIGLVGYTPNPDDPYPPRPWPFPWPGPWPWPWITVFSPNDLSLGIQLYDPEPLPWRLNEEIMLHDDIAKIVGIEAFKLTNENLEYHHDKELGVTTILIHRQQQ